MGKNTIEFTADPDGVLSTAALAAPGKYAMRNGLKWQDTSKPVRDQESVVTISVEKILVRLPLAALSLGFRNYQETAAHAKSALKINYTFGSQTGIITSREHCLKFARDEIEMPMKVYRMQVNGDKQLLPRTMWHLQKVLQFPPSYITEENRIIRNDIEVTRAETVVDAAAEQYLLTKMDETFHTAPTTALRREMIVGLSHRFCTPIPDAIWENISIQASEEEVHMQQNVLELQQRKLNRKKQKEFHAQVDLMHMADGKEDESGDNTDIGEDWWNDEDKATTGEGEKASSSGLPSYVSSRK